MSSNVADEIKLQPGASAAVKLKGSATAGYIWNYTTDDKENCISISKNFESPAQSTAKAIGVSSDEIFTITAQKKGIVHVYFFQRRSWKKVPMQPMRKKLRLLLNDRYQYCSFLFGKSCDLISFIY